MTTISTRDYRDKNLDTTKEHLVINNDNVQKQQISTTDQTIELQKKALSIQTIHLVIFALSVFLRVLPIASLAVPNIEFDRTVEFQLLTIELSDSQLNQK
ncbi:MAG: hypothetical protein QNJ37_16850 [Crocosphaera sp.]|nr:hypothetical protein [Crocosphaera sp.]